MPKDYYFFIDLNFFPDEDQIFPFSIYVYEPQSKQYKVDLNANSAFNQEKRDQYKVIESRGGKLAISFKQKKTFLFYFNKKESQIPSLNKTLEYSKVEEERLTQVLKLQEDQSFVAGEEFKNALSSGDFENIIDRARIEITLFPLNVSQNLSNAIRLCELYLREDNFQNRVIATSYFVAKFYKIQDPKDLGDLILASFFYDVGLTQTSYSFRTNPQTKFSQDQIDQFENHPGLTMHLLRKSGIKFEGRVQAIIQEHHERFTGTGFPHKKQDPYLDKLAQILGLVDYVYHFSQGYITGEKLPLTDVVSYIRNKVNYKGLNYDFDPEIVNVLYGLIIMGAGKTKAAA
jgi:response regulator RpfG family c-di-GMP phosphodiesterase